MVVQSKEFPCFLTYNHFHRSSILSGNRHAYTVTFFILVKLLLFLFMEHERYFGYQVEENVAAAMELNDKGKDEETLSEVEAILKPVKNQTWPSGIQQS